MRKKGFLPPKTETGQIHWVLSLFFCLFLGVFLCSFFQMESYKMSSAYLEDALAASNLASAVMDVREYGISGRIWIADAEEAYGRYQEAVKGNLNLNENWECPNKNLITGSVQIQEYIIYDVSGNDVFVSRFDESGGLTQEWESMDTVRTPDGKGIESTGVYSRITYMVEGIWGMVIQAEKGKLVDIVTQ